MAADGIGEIEMRLLTVFVRAGRAGLWRSNWEWHKDFDDRAARAAGAETDLAIKDFGDFPGHRQSDPQAAYPSG